MEEENAKSILEQVRQTVMKPRFFVPLVAVMAVFVLSGSAVAFSESYQHDRIYFGVHIGPINVSGMRTEDAAQMLDNWQNQWWNDKMAYQAYDERNHLLTTVNFYPIVGTEDQGQSNQFIWFDTQKMVASAFDQGRSGNLIDHLRNQIGLLLHPVTLSANVQIDEAQLKQVLKNELAGYETDPVNAQVKLVSGHPTVVAEQAGNTFDYEAAVNQTKDTLRLMQRTPIAVYRSHNTPVINETDVQTAIKQFNDFKKLFPLKLTYQDDRMGGLQRDWSLDWVAAAPAVEVTKQNDKPQLSLNAELLHPYFGQIEEVVNTDAKDAKFSIGEDKKVEQFQPAEKGYAVDEQATIDALNFWISTRLDPASQGSTGDESSPSATPDAVTLAVQTVDPTVATADVNDLGITQVLGVGYSNFSGSPANRVHNIGVGASKLNGLLIPPGEEFSLLKALKPFTASAGFLPELVIKGDKIEPEIGGGLCQIGTTTFRAAMNSGLQITDRRNHSLVVSYYNDQRNGNPGTDATIYDPAPDLKFVNDTGHYILIETEMNRSNGDLAFTFWGTSDGRTASYSEPVIERWIAPGPDQEIPSTDLQPGEKKCQFRHPGAVTDFTYTIVRPDGTKDEQDFRSEYRALPKICLVGVDPNQDQADDGTAVDSNTPAGDADASSPATQSQPAA